MRDLSFSLRLFRRSPGFSILSVVILGLGIGATAAIFSLVDGILLNPLPYGDPGRLAVIWSGFGRFGGSSRAFTAPADFFDWRTRSRSFADMAAYLNTNRTFTGLDQPVTPLTHEVTANYFDLLGVHAAVGRTFLPGEDQRGHDRVAVVSYSLWRSVLGGEKSAIGRNIELDGANAVLVGVLPPGFRVPNNGITAQPDLWVPVSFEDHRQDRLNRSLVVFGRLRPGVTPGAAHAEMISISRQIARENAADTNAPDAEVRMIRDDLMTDIRGLFLLLLGAVAIMLLIACANVANLLLTRSAARARELAMRTALGASRVQIARQVLTESVVLFLAGGAFGVVLAKFSVAPLLALVPLTAGLPFAEQVDVNLPVLAFSLGLSALTALLFGLVPARQALQANVVDILKESGRSGTAGRGGAHWRRILIVGEVTLSMVLLAGAGLMLQTFWQLSRLNSGFDAAHVLTVRNSLRGADYATPEARRNHFTRAAARLAQIPGVESVSAVSFPIPLQALAPARFVRPEKPPEPGHESTSAVLVVMPHYFETLRTPVVEGRPIADMDTADAAPVAVISQTLARRYFADADPLGRSIRLVNGPPVVWRIVGVVGDIRSSGSVPDPQPIIYLPHTQAPVSVMTFVLRTRVDPASLGPVAERTLWSTGRLMNVYMTMPLGQRVEDGFWQSRFTMILLTVFAALALTLAVAGLYAVISHLASQRTQEIGIRMALGARPRDVLWMVTRQGVALAATGVGIGVAASLALGRLIATRLYGVAPTDAVTLGAVAAILMTAAAAACAVPALRAARVDPGQALGGE